MEEYTTLLRCLKIQVDKAYSRAVNVSTLKRNLILAHPDMKKRVDVFALSIYRLIVFLKVLGHVDEAVSDLKIHRMCAILASMISQPLLESRQSFLSGIFRELFPIERISGHTEARRHFRGKMDSDSPKSLRRGSRMESPLDGP
ncbi:hypothetical protein Golob_018123 [Gossypium lobatum]|uniref:Uncharacterized protein n=1 Tax=Gossypium lobatum TaxID=34289 RepID=A0A7J8M997_9ROSI|nr:hypothetical protein [Gossypium lobatum]